MTIWILIKSISYRLSPLLIVPKRAVTQKVTVDPGIRMKLLNDKKQFKKALELFDKHKENDIQTFSSLTITQSLKACAHLRELQRGLNIHNLLSSRANDDMYILVSLIHLYSTFTKQFSSSCVFF